KSNQVDKIIRLLGCCYLQNDSAYQKLDFHTCRHGEAAFNTFFIIYLYWNVHLEYNNGWHRGACRGKLVLCHAVAIGIFNDYLCAYCCNRIAGLFFLFAQSKEKVSVV